MVFESNGDIIVTSDRSRLERLFRVNPADPDDETGDYGFLGNLPSNLTEPVGIVIETSGTVLIVDDATNSLWRINLDDVFNGTNLGSFYSISNNILGGDLNSDGDLYLLGGGNNLDHILYRVNPADPDDETGVYGEIGILVRQILTNPRGIGLGL